MEAKALISIVVILLTFIGYVPYIIDIIKNKTQPHIFTWIVGTITAFTAYALQVLGGAGVGAWPMLVVSVLCLIVLVLSVWRGTKDITKSDVFFLILSLVGVALWLIVDQPILSVLVITAAEIFGYIPTVRKSWKDPHSETAALYNVSFFRHGLSILALEKMNLLTVLYPAAWTLINLIIALILIYRRKMLKEYGWEDESFYVKKSKIHGWGLFTKKKFKSGEVVLNWNPTKELSEQEVKSLSKEEKHYLNTLSNGKKVLMGVPDRYVNHSDNPNTKVENDADVALRDIERGEEITSSYLK